MIGPGEIIFDTGASLNVLTRKYDTSFSGSMKYPLFGSYLYTFIRLNLHDGYVMPLTTNYALMHLILLNLAVYRSNSVSRDRSRFVHMQTEVYQVTLVSVTTYSC